MIKKLEIKNFKSLKHLKLDCKRINVLIGKPNTGKSNILESVGFLSSGNYELRDIIRLESMANLFYDQDIHQKVEVCTDSTNFIMTFQSGSFKVEEWIIETKPDRNKNDKRKKFLNWESVYDFSGFPEIWEERSPSTAFKYYKFAKVDVFTTSNVSFLEPPDGRNLLTILQTSSELRRVVNDILSDYGFKIVFKPLDNKIEILKGIAEDIIISYPYTLISDTLQRVVFYLAAIETNKDSVLEMSLK